MKKRITHQSKYNYTYAEPQSNTVVSEFWNKNAFPIFKHKYIYML